jgi:hypothetical protein
MFLRLFVKLIIWTMKINIVHQENNQKMIKAKVQSWPEMITGLLFRMSIVDF